MGRFKAGGQIAAAAADFSASPTPASEYRNGRCGEKNWRRRAAYFPSGDAAFGEQAIESNRFLEDGMRVKDWKVHLWECKTAGSSYTATGGQSLAEHSEGIQLPSKKYKGKKYSFSPHNLVPA